MIARVAVAIFLTCASVATEAQSTRITVSREVYLMGTRAFLTMQAPTREDGVQGLERAIRELEATEQELSTWIDDSAISRLNRQPIGLAWRAEAALCETFRQTFGWHRETLGAFDPGIGRLIEAWDLHGRGRTPSPPEIDRALQAGGLAAVAFDAERCELTRLTDVLIDVGAFGKGEALNRAATPLTTGRWLIDLGGQVAVGGISPGDQPFTVAIAHPRDRRREALRLALRSGSLSTTAGSERDLVVRGRRVGHVLDPRTGSPAPFDGSVTVWHQDALAADALSTALYVMGPDRGLRWAATRGLSVGYLVPTGDGSARLLATEAFERLLSERE